MVFSKVILTTVMMRNVIRPISLKGLSQAQLEELSFNSSSHNLKGTFDLKISFRGFRVKMAMSREIPINVDPEFRWRSVMRTKVGQGKPRGPRIGTRSYSLPSEPSIFLETLNPKEREGDDVEGNSAEISRQGLNEREMSENDKFSGNVLTLSTDLLKEQGYNGDTTDEQLNKSEEREQRRHFFQENPVVGDLVRVFEEHYTSSVPSRPIKLGRRNTYGPESSGESHLAPTRRTLNASGITDRNDTSFDIPIYVESDGRKDGTLEIEGSHFCESHSLKETGSHQEPQPSEQFSDCESELVEPKSSYDEEIHVSIERDNGGVQERINEEINDKREEYQAHLHPEESNIVQGQRTIEDQPEPFEIPHLPPRASETGQQESEKKLLQIGGILKKADDLAREVDAFSESIKTKEYLILEEVLTRCLIELDAVEANQDENVRVERKKGVQILQQLLAQLEEKIEPDTIESKAGRDDTTES